MRRLNTLEETVAGLRALVTSNRPGWVREFDAGLAEIIALNDLRAIPLLLGLFDDNCEYDEAMFSLIHTVEHYDRMTYLSQLLAQSPALFKQAPRWLKTLFLRVVIDDVARGQLTGLLKTASPEVKQTALKIIETVAQTRPEIAPKLIKVRTALTDS